MHGTRRQLSAIAHAPGHGGRLELWGGVECTINRLGNAFVDQCQLTGHRDRDGDIDLIAGLGLAALRYPILWESIAPDAPERCDWSWHDRQLARLHDLPTRVIGGLVHHGSGPRYTDLLDDQFAVGLARHALAAAQRYDWIADWTPVNEPLTTARFSALYGHWYPHRREEGAFWRALLNQIDAIRLSMAAVRQVNPAARLIQTEDLGQTFATAALRDQAVHDNLRRWATWDLLTGRLGPSHPLWPRIAAFGLGDRLRRIQDDPCPPDIIGINHYLTSDRFLDHRLGRYPLSRHGGNGRRRYADVEAIRALDPAPPGLAGALREAWDRYHIPLALTEVHNGCTREEQARWLTDAWDESIALRAEGVDVRAVTSWAVFGSQGWNTLLTAPGRYEVGAFDVSSGRPRPTLTAQLIQQLSDGAPRHSTLHAAGWWKRPLRLKYPATRRPAPMASHHRQRDAAIKEGGLLICGATGTLGRAIANACRHRNINHALLDRQELDLDDPIGIAATLDRYRPWGVINAAGWVRVDDAEDEPEGCFRANAAGAITLAQAAGCRDVRTAHFSSDLVFAGTQDVHAETHPVCPLNVYGLSKAAMERGVGRTPGSHLIVRTAAFFSAFDDANFAVAVVRALRSGERFRAAVDQIVSPTYVPALADAVLDQLIDGETGISHLSNVGAVSWKEFAVMIARKFHLDEELIDGVRGIDLGWRARRPGCSALTSTRSIMLGRLEDAVDHFYDDVAGSDRSA